MDSSSAASQAVIVSSATGTVIATDADGNTRVLQPGDQVFPGETVTSANGEAVLVAAGGQTFSIQPGQPLSIPSGGFNQLVQEAVEAPEAENSSENALLQDGNAETEREIEIPGADAATNQPPQQQASSNVQDSNADNNQNPEVSSGEGNEMGVKQEAYQEKQPPQQQSQAGEVFSGETALNNERSPFEGMNPKDAFKGQPSAVDGNSPAPPSEFGSFDSTTEFSGGDNLPFSGNSGLGAPPLINTGAALSNSNYQFMGTDSKAPTPEYSSPISFASSGGTPYSPPSSTNSPIDLGTSQTSSYQKPSVQQSATANPPTTINVQPQPDSPSAQGPSDQPSPPPSSTQSIVTNDTATVISNSRLLEQTSVLANDSGDGLTVSQVNDTTIATSGTTTVQGVHGTLTIQADGSYSYTPEAIDLSSDMVASWQFDEATGATVVGDSSSTDFLTNNATLSGNASLVSDGLSGNALQLNTITVPTLTSATLLSQYSMDGIAAGATQISNNAGTASGTSSGEAFVAGTSASPQGSGHLALDGTEHLNIETGLDSSATDVTLSFWFRWNGGDNQMLASFGNYDIWIRDGRIGFNTWDWDIYGQDINNLELAPGSQGLANEWHMITATFHDGDPTQSVLRIDGITQQMEEHDLTSVNPLAGQNGQPEANSGYSYSSTSADIHQTLNFGGYSDPDGNTSLGAVGGMDDLQIYSGTMTDSEAEALYLSSAPGSVHIEDSQEINIPADGVIEARTITLAFQPSENNDLNGRQVLYEEGGGTNGIIIYIHDNTLYAGAYSNSSGWTGEFLSTSLASLDSSEFHRVTLSLDSSAGTMTAWLDGDQIGQSTSAQAVSEHSGDVSIGSASNETPTNTFHDGSQTGFFPYSGLIDDVRIYDRALTNAEAVALSSGGESQTETFTYTATDSDGQTETATLDITVQAPQNHGPDANNDTLNIGADQTAAVNSLVSTGLLGNDTDAEGNPLTVTQVGDTSIATSGTTNITGQYGTLIITADGTYSYAPLNSATTGGTDTFSYTVSDGTSTSTAQLTVNVIASSAAASDSVTIRESSMNDSATYMVTRSGNDGILTYFDTATGETQNLGTLTGSGTQSTYEVSISMSPTGVMYGIDNTNLYTINPVTQAMTTVGAHGVDVYSMTGLAVTPSGAIYATGYNGHLYTIDSSTGAATDLGIVAGADYNFSDMAWHDGALYTTIYNYDSVTQAQTYQLVRINLTSSGVTTTDIGSASINAPSSHAFYSTGEHLIIGNSIVNPATGATTPLANTINSELESGSGNAAYSDVQGNVLSNDTNLQSVSSILDINGNAVTVTETGVTVTTTYGELTIQSDGSYTYSLDNNAEPVDSLAAGETANDRFVYTAVDSNGTSSQAVLTVFINGSHELSVVENTIEGTDSSDILTGGMDNDKIIGGGGNDTLTGGGGIDFFTWGSGDEGTTTSPAVDTITDFSTGAQGDVLDLSDLLPDNAAGSLDQYLSISSENGNTTIGVSTTAGGQAVQQIVLDNVDLTSVYGTTDTATLITNLTNDGNLQT